MASEAEAAHGGPKARAHAHLLLCLDLAIYLDSQRGQPCGGRGGVAKSWTTMMSVVVVVLLLVVGQGICSFAPYGIDLKAWLWVCGGV